VFGNALLSKEFPEELFCWSTSATLHAFQSALDALDRFHPVLSFEQLLVAFSILNDQLGFTVNS
jgi:hypothetical protein